MENVVQCFVGESVHGFDAKADYEAHYRLSEKNLSTVFALFVISLCNRTELDLSCGTDRCFGRFSTHIRYSTVHSTGSVHI